MDVTGLYGWNCQMDQGSSERSVGWVHWSVNRSEGFVGSLVLVPCPGHAVPFI